MDYYSSLNSASQQSATLDYASAQLLSEGTQGLSSQLLGFSNEYSKQIGDINAEYQGKIAEITGSFARKDTTQEQLVSALEGAGAGLEMAKSAKTGYEKYSTKVKELKTKASDLSDSVQDKVTDLKGQAEGKLSDLKGQAESKISDLKGQAEGKISEAPGSEARGRTTNSQFDDTIDDTADTSMDIELAPIQAEDKTSLPNNDEGESKLETSAWEDKEIPTQDETPTQDGGFGFDNPPTTDEGEVRNALESGREGYDTPFNEIKKPDLPETPEVATEGLAEVGAETGAETGVELGGAIALEETAGEIAVAGAFDPVVDVVAGGLMLAGVGVGLYDLFSKKKTEKKIKKEQDKAEADSQAKQDQAQAQYDTQVKKTDKTYDNIRNNITANTHAGIAIGVNNMRNTYKSGGTF